MTENERFEGQKENWNVSRGTLNDAGTAGNGLIKNDYKLKDSLKINERIIHAKTRRRLNRYLFEQGKTRVSDKNLNFLAVFNTWLMINGRYDGVVSEVIEWGGYTKAWRWECERALKQCIEMELIRKWSVRINAVRIGLTDEGERILYLYDKFYDVVIQEIQVSHEKAMSIKKKKRSYKCKGQPPAPAHP